MRTAVCWLGLLGLAGCAGRGGGVARVNDRTLSVDRLAEVMVLAQPIPLTEDVAYQLASHWVDVSAFGFRMAAGDSLLDSATVLDIMRHQVRREIVAQWRQHILARAGATGNARRAAELDSVYGRQLLHEKGAQLREVAWSVVRRAAMDPWAPPGPPDTVATFAGGLLTAADLAGYVQYLSPATRLEMNEASNERIAQFLWGLVLQELLVLQADSAGVQLSETAFRLIAGQCRDAVRALWQHTNLTPASLASAGPALGDREQAAARRVEEYLEAAAARRVPQASVPPFLAVPVLRAVEWEIVPEQLKAVVHRAQRLLAATQR